jgi:hypothetical protein
MSDRVAFVILPGMYLIGLVDELDVSSLRTLKSPAMWSPVPLMGEARGPGGGRTRQAMVGQADMLLWLPCDELEICAPVALAVLPDANNETAKQYRAAKAARAGVVVPSS